MKTKGGDRRPSPARIGMPSARMTRINRICVGKPGADQNLDERAHALEREHSPACRHIRRLRDRLEHRKGL